MPFIGRGGSSPPSDTTVSNGALVGIDLDQRFVLPGVVRHAQTELPVQPVLSVRFGMTQSVCEVSSGIDQLGDPLAGQRGGSAGAQPGNSGGTTSLGFRDPLVTVSGAAAPESRTAR